MALNYSGVFYLDKYGTRHTISTMYRYKKSDGYSTVWTSGGSGGDSENEEVYTPTDSSYFTFTLLDDGTYSIAAKNPANMPAEVILPSTYNGKAVTRVADMAFVDLNTSTVCSTMTSIIIPNGYTSIGLAGCAFCENLTTAIISRSVTTVDQSIFYGATNLTVYCEAYEQPEGWHSNWNPQDVPVVWGYVKPTDSSYFTFTELEDGTYSISAKDVNNLPSKICIPSNYNGKAVTAIAEEGFRNATSVTQIGISSGITTIGYKAFDGCRAMTRIDIPNTVTSIGNTAFQWCTALTDVTLPSGITTIGDYTFFQCASLPDITIPDSVTSIGFLAFAHNTTMTNIIIPLTVDTMGSQVFFNCSNLTVHCRAASKPDGWADDWDKATYYDDTIPVVWNSMFTSEKYFVFTELSNGTYSVKAKDVNNLPDVVGIPSSYNGKAVTAIDSDAFYRAPMTKLCIPNSITTIGSFAFSECNNVTDVYVYGYETKLHMRLSLPTRGTLHCLDNNGNEITNIVIPNGTTTIPSHAFYGARNIVSITLPNRITSIGDFAFGSCSSLTNVEIPDSVTTIDEYAFDRCSSLTSVVIGDGVTAIKSHTFYGCDNLASVTIGNSVTSIGKQAFYGCSSLTDIVIPNSVISISDGAFGATGLTSITIPDSTTDVHVFAFSNCDIVNATVPGWAIQSISSQSLQTVVITSGSINSRAFYGLNSLTSVVIDYNVHSAIGDYTFYNCTSLASIVIGGNVTSIGDSAFYGCTSLTNITIPRSVTSIGESAFNGCDNLCVVYNHSDLLFEIGSTENGYVAYYAKILVNNGITTYPNDGYEYILTDDDFLFKCKDTEYTLSAYIGGEETITLPENINGNTYDISYMRGVVNVIIPDSVTSIGSKAFYNCSKLTSVVIGDSVTSIGGYAFHDCSSLKSVVIGDSVTTIGNSAFYGCSKLTEIAIPGSVTSISSSAFFDCSNLDSITVEDYNLNYYSEGNCLIERATNAVIVGANSSVIPEGVTAIEDAAFSGRKITSINIPDSVTSIGDNAFDSCLSLTEIAIPDGVTYIGHGAFAECFSLTSMIIPNGVTFIGAQAFFSCSKLTEITIPSSVTSIGWSAFQNCRSLTSVVIPDSVASIGNMAFSFCVSLTSVVIGDSVTSIEYDAFLGCESLTSVVIPNSVTTIGNRVFGGCSSLTIYCEATSQPEGWNENWNPGSRPVVWGYTG